MYSRKSWGGNIDPSISVILIPTDKDEKVSLLIFEWEDAGFLGRYEKDDSQEVRDDLFYRTCWGN